MQQSGSPSVEITRHYATAVDALEAITRSYFFQGRLSDAQHLLRNSLQLLEVNEAQAQQRLQLLLLYGQILIVDHLLRRGEADLLFAITEQARQLADVLQDQQARADALSLLGEAYYFTTIVARLKSGASPDSPQDRNVYAEALAYQRQALALRETLQDMRGVSESCFQIGTVYERWQELEQAQVYYARARQIADQHGYLFEKTEPARHVAIHVLRQGDLRQALVLALQTVELREAVGFKPYLPLDYLLVRDIYQMQGDTANAELYAQKASAAAEEIGFPELVSFSPNRRDLLASSSEEV